MRKIIVAAISLVAVCACSSIDCPVDNVVATVYELKKATGVADTLRDTLSILISRYDGSDSVLLNRSVNTTSLQLPISYVGDADTLYFVVADTSKLTTIDRVIVRKSNSPHFESVDCAASYFHTIDEVETTHNRIDSISIKKRTVNYDLSTPHMYIYFAK